MATRRTPGTRAKDIDRTDTCQMLDSALAEGQLSMAEHRQRVSAATHATTLGELWSLVTDLQATNPVQPFATQPSKLPRGPVVIAAVTGVVIVICAAIALALMSNGSSTPDIPTASASAEAPETLDRHRTLEGSGHARRRQHPHLHQQRFGSGFIDLARHRAIKQINDPG